MPRALSRTTISFGLVSIPVDIFSATSLKSIHFNLLHAKDNSRILEKIICIAENKEVDRSGLVHGFPVKKGHYISFSNDELKEMGASREINIAEFVPIDKVDPVYFASSYVLGSRFESAKAYHLLTAAMKKTGLAALAKFVMRGKEHLVLIRPYRNVLMLHTMHYADEIRSVGDIGGRVSVTASELKLADRLISELSKEEFRPDEFEDTYQVDHFTALLWWWSGYLMAGFLLFRHLEDLLAMAALTESLKATGKPGAGEGAQRASRSRQRLASRHQKTSARGQSRRSARS